MITDQFFNSVTLRPLVIPDEWRDSYLRIYIWLTAHNYSVPKDVLKKAEMEKKKCLGV